MRNEVTNEQILTAIGKTHVKIEQMDVTMEQIQTDLRKTQATVERLQEAMNAGFARVDEQFEDLALMTKIQFDEVDRKLSILGARTRGFGLWP